MTLNVAGCQAVNRKERKTQKGFSRHKRFYFRLSWATVQEWTSNWAHCELTNVQKLHKDIFQKPPLFLGGRSFALYNRGSTLYFWLAEMYLLLYYVRILAVFWSSSLFGVGPWAQNDAWRCSGALRCFGWPCGRYAGGVYVAVHTQRAIFFP